MSFTYSMWTSISGMNAQSTRFNTIAENIANVSTTGYKRVGSEFSSLVLDGAGDAYASGGVIPTIRRGIGEQGGLQYTASVTDLAISGDGFFVVSGADGQSYLTRAGAFVVDSEGRLVNSGGYSLLGYPLPGGASVANGLSGLSPITMTALPPLSAIATTAGEFAANLPADAAIVAAANLPSANAASAEYSAKSTLVAFDSLGREVMLDVYMTKSAAGTWEVAMFDHATAASGGGFPYSSGPLATTSLEFDANGQLASTSPSSLSVAVPGGETLELDLSGMTQVAAPYSVSKAKLNGNAPSNVEHMEIAKDGTVFSIYGNGERVATHRIPLATVPSPDNLLAVTGNVFALSAESGAPVVGDATSNGFGAVVSGALENSTVDIASELTSMIETQKNYTANSKVFQASSDLMDVLMNIRA